MRLSRSFLKKKGFRKTVFSRKILYRKILNKVFIFLVEDDRYSDNFRFFLCEQDILKESKSYLNFLSIAGVKKLYNEETLVTEDKIDQLLSYTTIPDLGSYIKGELELQYLTLVNN